MVLIQIIIKNRTTYLFNYTQKLSLKKNVSEVVDFIGFYITKGRDGGENPDGEDDKNEFCLCDKQLNTDAESDYKLVRGDGAHQVPNVGRIRLEPHGQPLEDGVEREGQHRDQGAQRAEHWVQPWAFAGRHHAVLFGQVLLAAGGHLQVGRAGTGQSVRVVMSLTKEQVHHLLDQVYGE